MNTALAVLSEFRSSVPAVRVTRPVNVVVVVLSPSVKFPVPLIVVAPATLTMPVVLTVSGPVTPKPPGNATAALPLMIVPPAPAKLNIPVPVNAMLLDDQVIPVVAVIVRATAEFGPSVTLGTLNVPAV